MAEHQIVSQLTRELEDRGAWVAKLHGHPMQRRGLPDLVVCYRGYFLGVEAKDGARLGQATDAAGAPVPVVAEPLQEYELRRIRQAGGIGLVVASPADIDRLLRNLRVLEGLDRSHGDTTGGRVVAEARTRIAGGGEA